MSIAKLLDILGTCGTEPTPMEVAEALWWLLQIETAESQPLDRAPEAKAPSDLKTPKMRQEQPPPAPPEPEYDAQASGFYDPARTLPLFVPDRRRESAQDAAHGLTINTPAVIPLPGTLNIARSLRLLRQRVPSNTVLVFDEQATVHRSAEEHTIVPVLHGLSTARFAVDMIVDESESMFLWRSTIIEFVRLLSHLSAFRDVRVWGFDPSSPDPKQVPQLYAGLRRSGTAGNRHLPSELIDVGGQRLLLIVSDCVAPGWHSGAVARMMQEWERTNPMAIVQMLPRWLWERTSLGREIRIEMRSPYAGAPSARLIPRLADARFDDGDKMPPGVAAPVLALDPTEVADWARHVVAAPSAWTAGVQLSTVSREPRKPYVEEIDAATRVHRFYANASPQAQVLAEHLAAAPLTLPVINLVQQILAEQENDETENDKSKKYRRKARINKRSHIYTAEVLLGGLAYRVTPPDQQISPDEILYDFWPGVRELLLEHLDRKDLDKVFKEVSAYIEQASPVRQMHSGVQGSLGKEQIAIVEDWPFAEINVLLLERWGYTEYTKLVGTHVKSILSDSDLWEALQFKRNLEPFEQELRNSDLVRDPNVSFVAVQRQLNELQLAARYMHTQQLTYAKRSYEQKWLERAEHLLNIWDGSASQSVWPGLYWPDTATPSEALLPLVQPRIIDILKDHEAAAPQPLSESQQRLKTMLQGWIQVAEAVLAIQEPSDINHAEELLHSGARLIVQVADEKENRIAERIAQAAREEIIERRRFIAQSKKDAKKARAEKLLDKARGILDQIIKSDATDIEAQHEHRSLLAEIDQRQNEARIAHERQNHDLSEAARSWAAVYENYLDGMYPVSGVQQMRLSRWLQQAENWLEESEEQIAQLCHNSKLLCNLVRAVDGSASLVQQEAHWREVTRQVEVMESRIARVHPGMQSGVVIYRDLLQQIKNYASAHTELLQHVRRRDPKSPKALIANLKEIRTHIQAFDQRYQGGKQSCDFGPIDVTLDPSWKQVEHIERFV